MTAPALLNPTSEVEPENTFLAQRYRLYSQPEWQHLLTFFDLNEGFALIVLLTPDGDGATVCERGLSLALRETGKRLDVVSFPTPDSLRGLAVTLLAHETSTDVGAVWFAAAVPEGAKDVDAWRAGWQYGLSRLNESRNELRAKFHVPLVLVGAPWVQTLMRETAPDLWSVRTHVFRILPPTEKQAYAFDSGTTARPMEVFGYSGDPYLALQEAERLRDKPGRELALARLLFRAAEGFLNRSDWKTAEAILKEVIDLRRRFGKSPGDLAYAQERLADSLIRQNRYTDATGVLADGLNNHTKSGQLIGQANCLHRLGHIALICGDNVSAQVRFRNALSLFIATNDILGQANCLFALGDLALYSSENDAAKRLIEQALVLFERSNKSQGQAACFHRIGILAVSESDFATAYSYFSKALYLYRQNNDVLGQANCLRSMGEREQLRGNIPQARKDFSDALSLYQMVEDLYSIGATHIFLMKIAENEDMKALHHTSAYEALATIGRTDLITQHLSESD